MNVDVDDGIVTLRGIVDFVQQKQDAERVVKETDGVQAVVNKLRVSKRWRIQHDPARRKTDQPAAIFRRSTNDSLPSAVSSKQGIPVEFACVVFDTVRPLTAKATWTCSTGLSRVGLRLDRPIS
jgi:hypothetical protein